MSGSKRFVAPVILTALISAGSGLVYGAIDTGAVLQSARNLVAKDDLKGAETQLRDAAQRAPQDGSIRVELARVYMRQRNFPAAEAELLAAKQRGIASDTLAMMLAEVMFRSGQFGELLREVPARDRRPDAESMVRTYRGLAELALGNANQAQEMLLDAERLDSKAVPPKIAMARLLLNKKDLAAADRKIDEALALAPRDGEALLIKGNIAFSRGNAADALKYLNVVLKENPNDSQALADRANLYISNGEIDRAEKDVQTLQKLNENKGSAVYLTALIAVQRADYRAADVALNNIRRVMDRLPESYLLAGIVKYHLNQTEQAEAYLTRYIAHRQDSAVAYQFLGANALKKRDPDRAVALLEQALKLDPKNPNIIGLLGEAHTAAAKVVHRAQP